MVWLISSPAVGSETSACHEKNYVRKSRKKTQDKPQDNESTLKYQSFIKRLNLLYLPSPKEVQSIFRGTFSQKHLPFL